MLEMFPYSDGTFHLLVDGEGEVHEDSIVFSDGKVMHHDRGWQLNVNVQLQGTPAADDIIMHPRLAEAVPDAMQFPCRKSDLVWYSFSF